MANTFLQLVCEFFMSNVESMDYTHSHPSTIASLSSAAQLSPVPYTHHIPFLKTATIPTYYGISIVIPRYIAMQLSTVLFYYDTFHHCHIALYDHVVDIVFVAKPPFIFFIHVSLDHCTSRYTAGGIHIESYFCSKYRVAILEL